MTNSDSTTNYPLDLTTSRRDLAAGFVFSLCCFTGLVWVNALLRSGPPVPLAREVVPNIRIVLPRNDPDDTPVAETPQQTPPADIAPPTLTDVPQIAPPSAFTLVPEPPPPPGLAIDPKALTVPAGMGVGRGAAIFNPANLDEQPVATYQPAPVYPYDMKKAGEIGTVVVDFILEADGHVSSAYATSATSREFEAGAIQAVMKWRFHPGRRGGRAVRTHLSVPINFQLNDQ